MNKVATTSYELCGNGVEAAQKETPTTALTCKHDEDYCTQSAKKGMLPT